MGAFHVGSSNVTRGTGRRKLLPLPVVVALASVLALALGAGSALAGHTERVSVNPQGDSDSWTNEMSYPCVSEDGRYVVFESAASNLVAGDTNAAEDVFLRDRVKGETRQVSVASDGTQGNGASSSATISRDGRYIAFRSSSTNLVAGDTNGFADIFVHDQVTGQTERVNVASDETQADETAYNPTFSGDGRYLAFTSCATNLVAGDTNSEADVFIRDRQTGETTRASLASDGTQGNACSGFPSLSADGRYVAFFAEASNLVAGDTNATVDIFVRDRQTGETERVSVAD